MWRLSGAVFLPSLYLYISPIEGEIILRGLRFLLKTGMELPLAVPILNEELGKGHAYPFCPS